MISIINSTSPGEQSHCYLLWAPLAASHTLTKSAGVRHSFSILFSKDPIGMKQCTRLPLILLKKATIFDIEHALPCLPKNHACSASTTKHFVPQFLNVAPSRNHLYPNGSIQPNVEARKSLQYTCH
jgi:hypothetical protein